MQEKKKLPRDRDPCVRGQGFASGRIRFFGDEKIFIAEEYLNCTNNRWLARDPDEVPVVPRVNFPARVHALGVMSSEGDVMAPHFFKKG
jgi:hypothetical protein